jgi:RimJ/RimL family protein N-acetyltransferase
VLTGSKVLLRPWTPTDADDVFAACQDPEIQRWTSVPSPYTHADAVAYVTEVAPAAWDRGGAVFAVLSAATGELAGSIGAHGMTDGVAHIGYWSAPTARERGLTSDALRTLTCWFLREGGATRVELIVEPVNVGSVRVAEAAEPTSSCIRCSPATQLRPLSDRSARARNPSEPGHGTGRDDLPPGSHRAAELGRRGGRPTRVRSSC